MNTDMTGTGSVTKLSMACDLGLITYPNPLLSQISREVREDEFGGALANFTDDLLRVMVREVGVGLAAVQVGDLRRILVLRAGDRLVRMVNPTLVKKSALLQPTMKERCLSFPGKERAKVRSRSVTVMYRTCTGETKTETFYGYDARVVQHEMDHLDGKTIA